MDKSNLSYLQVSPFVVFQSTLLLAKIAVKLPFAAAPRLRPFFRIKIFLDISISTIKRCRAMMIITAVIPRRHLWSPSALLETSFYWPVRAMCISLSCRQHISIMDYFKVFPPTCTDNVCSGVCVCCPSLGMANLSVVDLIFCICCSFAVVLPILVHPFQPAGAQYFCQKPICPLSWVISNLLSSSSMSPFCISFISRMHVSRLYNRAPNIILFKNSALRDSNLKVTEMFT